MKARIFPTATLYRVTKLSLIVFFLLFGAFSTVTEAQIPGDTFVHLFEWRWTDIAEECEEFLGPNGYKAAQISPPQEHALITDPAYPWWQRYQPVSYQLISRSGNLAEFTEVVSRCHEVGVDIYVDAVINHMTGVYSQDGGGTGPWFGSAGTPFTDYTYPSPIGSANGPDYVYDDFHHCELTSNDDISDYGNRTQVQTCELVNLADLDTGAENVQNTIAAYLNGLLDLGVAGFRIDAAKHMASDDIAAILSKVDATNSYGAAPYVFQEVINDNNEPIRDYEYYDPTQTTPDGFTGNANGDVTEFRFSNRVAHIFRSGQLTELEQLGGSDMIPAEHAVVFIDNHDTQRGSEALTYNDGDVYTLANVFMLAWPYGYPKIMSSFEFSQRNQGPPSDGAGNTTPIYTADPPDFTGWVTEHRWMPIANMVAFRQATASAPTVDNWWDNGNNQIAFSRGDKGFVVINDEPNGLTRIFQTGMPAGRYCNVIDGKPTGDGLNCTGPSIIVGSDGMAVISVDAKRAAAIHVDAAVSNLSGTDPIATSFQVTAETVMGQNVFVLGNVPELGSWDPDQAIALSSTAYPVWDVTVDLPPATQIEYQYIIKDGSSVMAENAPLRMFVTPGSGTETRIDIWRRSPVMVTFNVTAETEWGQNVYVTGNSAELGNLDTEQAVLLSPDAYPVWSGTIGLTPETELEYKYFKKDGDGNVIWEGGNNRVLSIPASGTVTQDDVWSAGVVNPYNTDIFLRGSMNGWGTANQMTLGDGIFTAILVLNAGDHQFKIASEDWATVDFGAVGNDTDIVLGEPKPLGAVGANLTLLGIEAGRYKFTMDVANPDAPTITVQKMFDTNPYGVDVFVRGSMNDWGIADPLQFADGMFTVLIQLDAVDYEFKIADANWSAANFGAGTDGQVIELNAQKTLVRPGDNLQLQILEAGLYTFTVDPTEPEQPIVTVQKAAISTITIHYRRNAGDYDGWGLHLWNQDPPGLDQSELDGVTWKNPRAFDGDDEFGKYVELSVINPAATFGFIIHNGDDKDHNGVDMFLTSATDGLEIWMIQGSEEKFTSQEEALQAAINLPDLYVRGTMNDWGTANKVTAKGSLFTAVLPLEAGTVDFKIADENWGTGNFGSDTDPVVILDTPKTLAHGEGNLQFTVPETGMYRFTLDASNPNAPILTVQQAQVAIIHYHRKNADYVGWGLHLWNFDPPALAPSVTDGITWGNPYPFDGDDDFGKYAVLDLVDPTATFGFIIHKGDEKDHGGLDMTLTPATEGFEIWMVQGYTDKFTSKEEALVAAGAVGNLQEARARWISRDSIAWDVDAAGGTPHLYYDPDGTIGISEGAITFGPNGQEIPLSFSGTIGSGTLNDQKLDYLPYVSDWARVDTSGLTDIGTLLTGALAIGLKNAEGQLVDATSIQTAGVLDDVYSYDGELGVIFNSGIPTLALWAPTAQSVRLILFDDPTGGVGIPVEMSRDASTGVWTVTGDAGWNGKYYVYEVTVFAFWNGELVQNLVTDPYAVSLSMNSTRSQIVNLADANVKPAGWDGLHKPELDAPEDIVLYEMHVRDFSISDNTVSGDNRGKFTAFTEEHSNGMQHLKGLAEAGLTHLHLLPVFDIATIDEDVANRVELDDTMDALCAKPGVVDELGTLCTEHTGQVIRTVLEEAAAADPASEVPQKIVMALRPFDGFNWGYDPFHYGVPEGSYCTDPNGATRIKEFRDMVSALSGIGLRVVMDVVYNHTNAARDHEKSVLDKIVPGYYYRLDDAGNIQNSTCCPDTATEHTMMEKLILDTLKRWAVQYKIDGFRFDLMGHHTRDNMQNVRAMLDSLTLAADGVDGSKIYIYGEGWKFGSIQTNLPSTDDPDEILQKAAFTQTNSAGAGIGSFNDRIRDMVRGAGFMKPPCAQGFISGLEYDPNGKAECTVDDTGYSLLNYTDNIRIGMAGNLKDYQFTGHQGNPVSGKQVAYFGGAPAGYTADPQEVINYAEAHDNRTLWDYVQFQAPFEMAGRVPPTTTLEERIRIQNLGLSLIALGQGIPFFHAGTDMLRSKSADEDSYDYGDWFNALDFSYESNNWGVGLPNADKNANEWDALIPLLRETTLTPAKADILKAIAHFRELLQIRQSSPLFRLRTADDIQQRVRFLNAEAGTGQIPGLIAMMMADFVGEDLDSEREMVLVAVNVTTEAITFSHEELIGADLELHPVLQNSADDIVKQAGFDINTGSLTIPARTAVVYQEE